MHRTTKHTFTYCLCITGYIMYAQQVICAHMLLMWQPTRLVFLHRKSSEMLEQYLWRELWQFGFEIFLGFEIFTQTVCFLTLAGCETWWFVQFLRAGKLLFIRDLCLFLWLNFLLLSFFPRIHWTLAPPWRRVQEWSWMQTLWEMLRTTSTLPGEP